MDWISFLVAMAAALTLIIAIMHVMNWLSGSGGVKGLLGREITDRLTRMADLAERTERSMREGQQNMRKESDDRGRALRKEVSEGILQLGATVQTQISDGRSSTDKRLEEFARTNAEFANALREEVRKTIAGFGEGLKGDVKILTDANAAAQETLRLAVASSQESLRLAVTERLDKLRVENEAKLEAMRSTVEEKLQGTLEKRLGESFALVSDRLEMVHKGLGEMQSLAIGVGDLKRVMSNVKDRGGWAEIQLGAMLEQVLARDQYVTNAKVEIGATEMVEFAVRMPGQGEGAEVLLPIDAKFPKETYERLMLAWEAGDGEAMRTAADELSGVIEGEAKRIASKYIRPPSTTDFAIMYVPTEGLFAEAMRAPGLAQRIQQRYRVSIAGPSTLHALLNSLQMGFRTLAIQKRSSEVWRVLGEAKSEFQKYAEVWDKLGKQLETAQNTIRDVSVRTRAVERKLRQVEVTDLPTGSQPALDLVTDDGEFDPIPLPVVRRQQ